MIGGLFLDGWSHLHRQGGRLGSFFTPWHAILYAGFTANAIWVVRANRHLWHADVAPHPALFRLGRFSLRYPFAVLGLAIVGAGMFGDLGWHTALGPETDVARVIAPFHVVLFLGASLLIAAPLRSAWHAPEDYPESSDIVRLLPAVLALALLSAAVSFLFQWASPFMHWTGSARPTLAAASLSVRNGLEVSMAARVVLASIAMSAPILLALRRWSLPVGAATLVWTVVALAMSALGSFRLGGTVVAAVAGGLAIDAAIRVARDRHAVAQLYVAAVAGPLVCWPVYFWVLRVAYDAEWGADFMLGATSLAAVVGVAMAFTLSLPDVRAARTATPFRG